MQFAFLRALSPDVFGIVALATSVLTIVLVVSRWGVSEAIVEENKYKHVFSTIFWLRFGFGVCLMLIIWLSTPLVEALYSQKIALLIFILAIPKFLNIVTTPFRAIALKEFELPQMGLIELLSLAIGAGVGYVLVAKGAGLNGLLAYYVVRESIEAGLYTINSPEYPSLNFDRESASWFMSFAKTVVVSKALKSIEGSGDDYIVGTIGGAVVLGNCNLAWRLGSAFRSVTQAAVSRGVLPTFSELTDSDQKSREGLLFVMSIQF